MSYRSEPGKADNLLILRGLASLGVLFAHSFNVGEGQGLSLQDLLELVFRDGGTSPAMLFYPETGVNFVLCFFVLSGYLMGKVFFMHGSKVNSEVVAKFYKRRFLRIAPLLYFSLFVCLAFVHGPNVSVLSVLGDVFFVNNLTGTSFNDVTWSISYEMQYYLIAPFVFALFSRKSFLSLGGLLLLFLFTLSVIISTSGVVVQVIRYLPFFLAGFFVNLAIRAVHPQRNKMLSILAYLCFFLGNGVYYYWYNQGAVFAAEAAVGMSMMFTVWALELPYQGGFDGSCSKIRELFTSLGVISYGVYLWHYPILHAQHDFFVRLLDPSSHSMLSAGQELALLHLMQLLSTLVLTLAFSATTFFFVELRYRDRLYNADSLYLGGFVKKVLRA